jgi:hypothetical protein
MPFDIINNNKKQKPHSTCKEETNVEIDSAVITGDQGS